MPGTTNEAGASLTTYSNKKVDVVNFTPDMIDIYDIAGALANECRYAGHVRPHYSVAQHLCFVHDLVPPICKPRALLHDASEAYWKDMPSDIKHHPMMDWYNYHVERCQEVIFNFFVVTNEASVVQTVHRYDKEAVYHEVRNFTNRCSMEGEYIIMKPMTQKEAEIAFLERFFKCVNLTKE